MRVPYEIKQTIEQSLALSAKISSASLEIYENGNCIVADTASKQLIKFHFSVSFISMSVVVIFSIDSHKVGESKAVPFQFSFNSCYGLSGNKAVQKMTARLLFHTGLI